MNPVESRRTVGQLHQPLAGALKLWQGGRELLDDAQGQDRDRLKVMRSTHASSIATTSTAKIAGLDSISVKTAGSGPGLT